MGPYEETCCRGKLLRDVTATKSRYTWVHVVAATHTLMCADTFSLAQHEFWEKFVPATCRMELNLLNFLGHVTATERYDLRMLGCAICPCGKNQYLSQSETTSSLLCSCALGKNGSCSKSFHRGVRGLASNWNDLDRKRKFLMYLNTELWAVPPWFNLFWSSWPCMVAVYTRIGLSLTILLSLFSPSCRCLSGALSHKLAFSLKWDISIRIWLLHST